MEDGSMPAHMLCHQNVSTCKKENYKFNHEEIVNVSKKLENDQKIKKWPKKLKKTIDVSKSLKRLKRSA